MIDSVLDMGIILTCDIAAKELIITNPNDQDIRIIDITISDLPGNAFAFAFYTKSAPIIVPAKGNAPLPIGFVPDFHQILFHVWFGAARQLSYQKAT